MSSERGERPRVLGVGSPKGGVGKTQTAVTLAHLASCAGYRVLLVDADENRSAEDWAMRAGDRIALNVAIERDARNLVRLHDLRDLDLIVVDLPGARCRMPGPLSCTARPAPPWLTPWSSRRWSRRWTCAPWCA